MTNFNTVEQFEQEIAKFYGAPYAIAVDCCTHAIELCLRHQKVNTVSCPSQTYISVPMTFEKLGLVWKFEDVKWNDYYYIGNTNIIDAAVHWKHNGYISGTMMCLSFQHKKHLSTGRGGAILLDSLADYQTLKKMSYDGRCSDVPWSDQDIDVLGYHYYMTPEIAATGLERMPQAIATIPKNWSYLDYPYLPTKSVFSKLLDKHQK